MSEPTPARAALEAVQKIERIAVTQPPSTWSRDWKQVAKLAREAAAHLAQVVEQENQP